MEQDVFKPFSETCLPPGPQRDSNFQPLFPYQHSFLSLFIHTAFPQQHSLLRQEFHSQGKSLSPLMFSFKDSVSTKKISLEMYWRILWKAPDPDSFVLAIFPLKLNGRVQINSRCITEHNTQQHLAGMIPQEGISPLARLLASLLPAPTQLRGSLYGFQLSSSILKYPPWANQMKLSIASFPKRKRTRWWCQELEDMFTALQHYPLNQLTTENALQGTAVPNHTPKGNKQNPLSNKEKRKHIVVIISPAVDMLSGLFPTRTFKKCS